MAAPEFDREVAKQFLTALLGNVPEPNLACLWRMPPRTSCWTRDVASAVKWTAAAVKERANAYCSVAVCSTDRGTDKRTSNDSAAGLLGFVADVDFANKAGAKKMYPADADAASSLILGTGLTPTIMVHSGNGLQAWWLFHTPWMFENDDERLTAIALSTAWGATMKEHARRAGCEVDSVHDLARVLRIPGSLNWKDPENPKPVTLVWLDEAKRYNPTDFEPLLLVKPEEPAVVRERTKRTADNAVVVAQGEDFPWAKHEALLANSEQYAATWSRSRTDMRDNSPSAWDMALANLCAQSGMSESETAAVLVACRRRHGDQIKPLSYYNLTIRKAMAVVDVDVNDDQLTRDERIEKIARALTIPLTNIQKISGTEPVYRFTLLTPSGAERAVEIAATQLINQGSFRGKMFALTDVPPRKIGPKEHPSWDDFVAAIAQAAEVIDAGEDATVTGEMLGLLEDYLQANRPTVLEDGALVEHPNHPFIRGGRVWFKANSLLRYASMNLGLKITKQVLTQRLVVLDAKRATIAVKKGKGKTTGSYYGTPTGPLGLDVEEEAT